MVGLRELRRARKDSLEAVGFIAEVDAATVSRIERGLIERPRRETVVRLAKALGISPRRCQELIDAAIREAQNGGATS